MDAKLLDDVLINEENLGFSKDENVLWSGNPKEYFSIALLDLFWRNTDVSIVSILQFVLLIKSLFTIKDLTEVSFIGNAELFSIFRLVICWIVLLIPEFYKNFRKRNTKYFITNHRVLIQTIKWFQIKIYKFPYHEILEVNYESYKDGFGLIHLKVMRSEKLKTRDFYSGSYRMYPTLEQIPNCIKVHKFILNTLKNNS